MASFDREVLETATRQREVTLATVGRKSGKTYRVTIWIITDGQRIFIRSGQGLRRHWPQNLLARGEAGFRWARPGSRSSLGSSPIPSKRVRFRDYTGENTAHS